MKSNTTPGDTLVVESSADGSLHDGDNAKGPSPTKVGLTTDEATEIALGTIDQEFTIDSDNSPFPEVRANVPNTDDFDLPVNTLRMWFLGIVFTMVFGDCLFLRNSHLTGCSLDPASTNSSQCDIPVLLSLHWWHNC